MKLVTYQTEDTQTGVGLLAAGDRIVDLARAFEWAAPSEGPAPGPQPESMIALLQAGPDLLAKAGDVNARLAALDAAALEGLALPPSARLLAPVPRPNNLRDFYAFEQHVKAARALRNLDMIPEWYEIPVFYFSNPDAIYRPRRARARATQPRRTSTSSWRSPASSAAPAATSPPKRPSPTSPATLSSTIGARATSGGATRSKLSMGPAKSKDFATSLGPWLVTPDELADRRQGAGAETRYNLEMVARVNGKEYSRGNAATLTHTFAQMIAWASQDAWLHPGDVLGSGTVGTGCILELRPETVGGWLKPGDVVELEIERLGTLRNPVAPSGV